MFLSTLSILASLITSVLAHNINLGAHSRECFHEQLHKDDKMTVTFQVGDREFGGSGNLEIDFWVRILTTPYPFCPPFPISSSPPFPYIDSLPPITHRAAKKITLMPKRAKQIQDPSGGYQTHNRGVSSGDHSFEARLDGKYTYCFSNEHWSSTSKEVSFNVHGIVYVPESEAPSDPLEAEGKHLSWQEGRGGGEMTRPGGRVVGAIIWGE